MRTGRSTDGEPTPAAVTITIQLNGCPVAVELDERTLATIAAAIGRQPVESAPPSPFLTIPEAAEYLRCARQRIDDLLSARRIPRVKEGARTLIRRSDLDNHLEHESKRRGR